MKTNTVKLHRKGYSDKTIENDLVLVSQQIGCIAETNCNYTAKLAQRIKVTGKAVSELTIAELIELDNLETKLFNQVNSPFDHNASMVDLSHRLFLLSYAFSLPNASMTINETVNTAISILILLEGQFAKDVGSRLHDGTIYFAFHQVRMIIEDIDSIITGFQEVTKQEPLPSADYIFSTIDKNLSNVRMVVSVLCDQFAGGCANHSSIKQIRHSIDAVKQDLANIGSIFSDLCKPLKHQA